MYLKIEPNQYTGVVNILSDFSLLQIGISVKKSTQI